MTKPKLKFRSHKEVLFLARLPIFQELEIQEWARNGQIALGIIVLSVIY